MDKMEKIEVGSYEMNFGGVDYFLIFTPNRPHNGFLTNTVQFGITNSTEPFKGEIGRGLSDAMKIADLVTTQIKEHAKESRIRYMLWKPTNNKSYSTVQDNPRYRLFINSLKKISPPNNYVEEDGVIIVDCGVVYDDKDMFHKYVPTNEGWLTNCTSIDENVVSIIEPLSIEFNLKIRERRFENETVHYLLMGGKYFNLEVDDTQYRLINEEGIHTFDTTEKLRHILT